MASKYNIVIMANLWISLAILVTQPISAMANGKPDTVSINSSLSSLSYARNQNRSECQQMLCSESQYNCYGIVCSRSGPILPYGYCVTYNEGTKLMSMSSCQYFEPEGYNVTSSKHILLPRNLSQLNDYMCGPLNRKGLVCSECADGFGPSVTSFGYRCVHCTDAWYGVPIFMFLELAPITVLYLIVLIFQISVTSPPIPCFIMYAQLVVIAFDSNSLVSFMNSRDLTVDLKIILTLYGVFNLDFGRYDLLPPFCVSSNLKPIHSFFVGYISAFYPILLVCLTWVCVELHGRNFRPLVWLWRPFHRCFVRLRRGWDTKSDIIDAFATFFFLSYAKIIYQTLLLLITQYVKQVDQLGRYFFTYHSVLDLSIDYRDAYYLSFAIPAVLVSLIFRFLPPFLLILYPIRVFRSYLSKCHLNFIAIHTFLDKVHSCYRNGLDKDRDMRSFSGLYFFLKIAVYVVSSFSRAITFIENWFAIGTLFFFTTLTVAIAKPYHQPYMNYLDITILSHLAITCYALSSGEGTLLLTRILVTIPITVFILTTILRKCYGVSKGYCKVIRMRKYCSNQSRSSPSTAESMQSSTVDYYTASQPLTQPTIRYGTCKDN